MFGSSSSSFSYAGPLSGSYDAEVAHGENESDTHALQEVFFNASSPGDVVVHFHTEQ